MTISLRADISLLSGRRWSEVDVDVTAVASVAVGETITHGFLANGGDTEEVGGAVGWHAMTVPRSIT